MIKSMQVVLLLAARCVAASGPAGFVSRQRSTRFSRTQAAATVTTWKASPPPRGFTFPIEGADIARVDAFGKSLVEFVDRQNPGKFVAASEADPTDSAHRRRAHPARQRGRSGAEILDRLPREALRSGVGRGASIPAGGGRRIWGRPKGCAAAPDAQPVQQYGARLAERHQQSRQPVSARRLCQRLQEPVRGAVGLADFGRRLQPRRRTPRCECIPPGRFARPDPLQARIR